VTLQVECHTSRFHPLLSHNLILYAELRSPKGHTFWRSCCRMRTHATCVRLNLIGADGGRRSATSVQLNAGRRSAGTHARMPNDCPPRRTGASGPSLNSDDLAIHRGGGVDNNIKETHFYRQLYCLLFQFYISSIALVLRLLFILVSSHLILLLPTLWHLITGCAVAPALC